MTRTEKLLARRLKKQQQVRRLQEEISEIDAALRTARCNEAHAELRQRREAGLPVAHTPSVFDPARQVGGEGCGEARAVVAAA